MVAPPSIRNVEPVINAPFSLIRSSATFATSSAVPGLPAGQQEEQRYYEEIIGLKGTFLFADTPQEARLKIISGQGYMPVDVIGEQVWFDSAVNRIPLLRNQTPVAKTYCAFWHKDNSGYYIEEFAEMLRKQF